MSPHPCPFTEAELLALYAIMHVRGDHPTLAARILAHIAQHPEGGTDES